MKSRNRQQAAAARRLHQLEKKAARQYRRTNARTDYLQSVYHHDRRQAATFYRSALDRARACRRIAKHADHQAQRFDLESFPRWKVEWVRRRVGGWRQMAAEALDQAAEYRRDFANVQP